MYESKTDNDPETTDYTNVLQFISQEEGRIRYKPAEGSVPASFVYDYFKKDYLGNVRMVLREEQQQDIHPAATLEGSVSADGSPNAACIEKNFYNIDPANIVLRYETTRIGNYKNKNGGPLAVDNRVNNNPNSVGTADSWAGWITLPNNLMMM